MSIGKRRSPRQCLIQHPIIGYIMLALIASSAMAVTYSYQAKQTWLTTAEAVAKHTSVKLSNALKSADDKQLQALIAGIAQDTPASQVSLVTGDGSVLASHTVSAPTSDTDSGQTTSNPSAHDVVFVLRDNRTVLKISKPQQPLWWPVAESFPAVIIVLILSTACGLWHYLHHKFALRRPVSRLLQLCRKADAMQDLPQSAYHSLSSIEPPSLAEALKEVTNHVWTSRQSLHIQKRKLKQLKTELTTHRQGLSKLVKERTAALVDLNKRFVQQQFDAKISALEAKRAHGEAEQANQDKTRFLAAASHDLRQPLHAINLFVEALEPELKTKRAQLIHSDLQRSLTNMKDLFNSLLDISKLDAGVMQPKIEVIAIQPLFDQLEVVFRQQAIAKNLDLRLIASKYLLCSDPHLLQQVLANLVANAIKHTGKGYVFVGCRREKAFARILVWDSGPGIPSQQQDAIFREFVQLNNPERDRSKGLGLGLSIVKRTCHLLDHDIRFHSVLGLGTRFEIVVPLSAACPETKPKRAAPTEVGQAPTAALKTTAEVDLHKQSILIIDDDPSVLRGMKLLLESWNLQPWLANSIDNALQLSNMANKVPDLIISDLRLPDGVTGVTAIQHIQGFYKANIPAILITGDTSPERLKLASESPYPLLHKPVKPAQLRSICASFFL